MSDYTDYYGWLAHGRWIRVSARAIIFDAARERILVEQNRGEPYLNFIGGGVEVGETLEECLTRELAEETDATVAESRYLFVVENFIPHGGKVRHSLEHYFEIGLASEEVGAKGDGVQYRWIAVAALGQVDLRPAVVRDCIGDGNYGRVRHLVRGDGDGDCSP